MSSAAAAAASAARDSASAIVLSNKEPHWCSNCSIDDINVTSVVDCKHAQALLDCYMQRFELADISGIRCTSTVAYVCKACMSSNLQAMIAACDAMFADHCSFYSPRLY